MEEVTNDTPAAAAATATATTSEGGAAPQNGGKRTYDRPNVEELFDLTKPIPSVNKPDKEEHDKSILEVDAGIDKLRADKDKVQERIEVFMNGLKSSEMGKERSAIQELKREKKALIDGKKTIRDRLSKAKSTTDKLSRDQKQTKQGVKFTSVKDIEDEIRRLERRQQTTSMSLGEEKKLIKEIQTLNASKSLVSQLKAKETNIQDVWDQRKALNAELVAKDKEIDAVQELITRKNTSMDAINAKESDNKDNKQKLFDERDVLKEAIDAKFKEKDALRSEFREANNNWYNFKRALGAQRRIRNEEEKKERETREKEWLKQKEEEELKKVPYEEEMALCDYLADFLTKTYLTDPKKNTHQIAVEERKKAAIVPVKDDPFAGFKPMKKNEDEVFLKMGKDKKPRNRQSKKDKKSGAGKTPFTLNLDTFDQFGLLSLTPPTSLDGVQKSVDQLHNKKKFYSEQERGAVKTATDIRKGGGGSGGSGSGASVKQSKKKGDKGTFSLSDDDFAPLSTSSGGKAVNNNSTSTWGQKIVDEPSSIAVDEMAEEFPVVSAEEVVS